MSAKEGSGGRFWWPEARATGSMAWVWHQWRVSASCSAKRSLESCHSLGARREVEETCWRGRLVGPPPPRGMSAEAVEGDERLAGRVAYLEWESCLR